MPGRCAQLKHKLLKAMRINWARWFKTDRSHLLRGGLILLFAAIIWLYLYIDKPRIKSKEDLIFVSGPFEDYTWVSMGGGKGSSLTFKMQNFPFRFKIKADFFPILRTNAFRQIKYGEILTVGIPKGDTTFLQYGKTPFFVYAISSSGHTYINTVDAIKKHNSPVLLYASFGFGVAGLLALYYARKMKA